MASAGKRPLKVFLCHASGDKPPVRDLYKRLVAEGVDAWLDREKLLPGQDWRLEIPRAVQEADVVVVCLSKKSVTKEGYVQKEIKFALDSAEEKPEGTIFLIPARLEECTVPERLSRWQWVDLYEENGFIQLLRSLKLRADAVGAAVEPTAYEDSDKEVELRVDQLYTEGLAAFYTEDWDKACHRFQTILSERPNHKNAAEKLAEAERQRNLAKLYAQSAEALRSENWQVAIRTLEELTQKSADYKDAASLLKNARRQKQLRELYAEAGKLHAAQKWQAVVKVFEQISAIDPSYPDPGGLLSSAQKEVAELKRLADLNDLYSHAVREMDAGQWAEARRLLEQVHKAQMGFLETERLLRKVEDEIAQVDEQNRRNEQVNVLYEQAHGLLRSKKWRKALDKMVEIQELDDRFVDKDGISEKAKKELANEEAEAQRENELSARYAEAVRLLKEDKFQEALDKWQEVRVVDPKYPDRQWVQRMAKRKLAETAKPIQVRPRFVMSKSLWMGMVGLIVAGVVITGVILSGKGEQKTPPSPISESGGNIITNPPATGVIPTSTLEPGLLYKEDFETGKASNWTLDPGWKLARDGNNYALMGEGFQFAEYTAGKEWTDYLVRFRLKLLQGSIHLDYRRVDNSNRAASVTSAGYFVEFRENYLRLSKMTSGDWIVRCVKDVKFATNTWHDVEVIVDQSDFMVYLDGALALQCPDVDPVRGGTIWFDTMEDSKAWVDDIEVEALPAVEGYSDPTMYDDFDKRNYDNNYNTQLWTKWTDDNYKGLNNGYIINQSNGQLKIGVDNGKGHFSLNSNTMQIAQPMFSEARLYLDPTTTAYDVGLNFRLWWERGELTCGITNLSINPTRQKVYCYSLFFGKYLELNVGKDSIEPGWHTLRFEISPEPFEITSFVDGLPVGKFSPLESMPDHYNEIKSSTFEGTIDFGGSAKSPTAYIDYVRMGAIEDDPLITSTPAPITAYIWNFDNGVESWNQEFSGITSPLSADGLLTFTTKNGNPWIVSPGSLQISSSVTPIITLRLSFSTPYGLGAIYFVTDKDGNWDERKKKVFSLRDSKALETYYIDMSMTSTWRDVITQFRLDPQEPSVSGVKIQIDYISVHSP